METVSAISVKPRPAVQAGAPISLSRPTSAWKTLWATVLKQLRVTGRYLPDLVGRFVEVGLRAFFLMLVASSISLHSADNVGRDLVGRDLFIFLQGGLLLMVFTVPTMWGPIYAIEEDLYNGTLEFLYSCPGSHYAYYVGTVLARVLVNMVVFLPLYGFLILYSRASLDNVALILLACVTVLITLTAMGILFALLGLLWRRVTSIAQVLTVLFEMLSGAILPVDVLPKGVQYLVYALPHTWAYDLIRYYSFDGQWHTILPVWQEWALVILYAIGFTLLSRYLLGRAELLAKRSGLHVI